MTLAIDFYFIGFYFMSNNSFNQIISNMDILISMYSRKSDTDNALYAI